MIKWIQQLHRIARKMKVNDALQGMLPHLTRVVLNSEYFVRRSSCWCSLQGLPLDHKDRDDKQATHQTRQACITTSKLHVLLQQWRHPKEWIIMKGHGDKKQQLKESYQGEKKIINSTSQGDEKVVLQQILNLRTTSFYQACVLQSALL